MPSRRRIRAEWVSAYIDNVLIPMLHLYAETGIGLEAHQQNTLVRLDGAGRIKGGAYRDNQGYYLASSYLRGLLAVTGLRDSTLAVVDDPIVDDRLTYYLLHNQALAVVGCLAADGVADEGDAARCGAGAADARSTAAEGCRTCLAIGWRGGGSRQTRCRARRTC